VPPFANAM